MTAENNSSNSEIFVRTMLGVFAFVYLFGGAWYGYDYSNITDTVTGALALFLAVFHSKISGKFYFILLLVILGVLLQSYSIFIEVPYDSSEYEALFMKILFTAAFFVYGYLCYINRKV